MRFAQLYVFVLFIATFLHGSVAQAEDQVSTEISPKDIVLSDSHGTVVTRQEVEHMFAEMHVQQRHKFLQEPQRFQQLLNQDFMLKNQANEAVEQGLLDDEHVRWRIEVAKRNILADALLEHWRENVEFPDLSALAREYYEVNPEEFKVPEKVNAAHILLGVGKDDTQQETEQRAKAEQLLAELKAGADFAELAKTYSDDKGSAQMGGVLNYFSRGRMVKPFEDAAFALDTEGALSPIVRSRFGFHIIKLLGRQDATVLTYDDVEQKLISQQKLRYLESEEEKYLSAFSVDKDVTFYVPAMDAVVEKLKQRIDEKE